MNVILRNEDYLDENLKKYQSSLGEIVFGYLIAGMLYLFFGGLLCAILESLLLFVSGITIIVGLLIDTIYINISVSVVGGLFVCFAFCFVVVVCLFLETGFSCVALAVLEFTL